MLTPEQIAALRDAAGQISDPINDFLLEDIARRVAGAGQLTSTASYQIWRAQQLGLSQREIKMRLQKLLGKSRKEINRLLTQSAEVGYRFDLDRLPTSAAIPFAKNMVIQQMVSAAVKLAQDDFTNITQTLGMVGPGGVALPLRDAYRRYMDYAFEQVFTGAADYNTAIRRATKNVADLGVRVIDYESGVHTSLEAAVRRNVMGGLGLMMEQITQRNHDDLGCDGWEISAHAASAPDHEPIQGRQYSDAKYKVLNGSLVRRIGTLNCGHAAFPIILGVNSPQYTPKELERFRADNEAGVTYEGRHYTMYEATQRQREIERAIRRQKNRILVDESTEDAGKLVADRIRLRRLNQEYGRFSKATGLPTQRERAQVVGFGRTKGAPSIRPMPEINHAQSSGGGIEASTKRFQDRLAKSGGLKDNVDVLRYYAETTDFVEDRTIPYSFAFDPASDQVVYNPSHPGFAGLDFDVAAAHELSHRADHMLYHATERGALTEAIERCRTAVMDRRGEVAAWFTSGGKYSEDMMLSDIMSALTRGAIKLPYGHSREFWKRPGSVESEIFADLSAIDSLGLPGKSEFNGVLKELYEAFHNVVGGGQI